MADLVLQRITTPADARPCAALARDYMAWLVGLLADLHGVVITPDEVEQIHADMRAEAPRLFADPGRLYLGTIDGAPVAIGALLPVAPGVGEIKRIYVDPAARGTGSGRIVMERLVADARLLGYRSLRLETFPFMEAAVGLYRSLGFREVARFAGSEGEGYRVGGLELFMELDLTA